jgi:hypothetical protein
MEKLENPKTLFLFRFFPKKISSEICGKPKNNYGQILIHQGPFTRKFFTLVIYNAVL